MPNFVNSPIPQPKLGQEFIDDLQRFVQTLDSKDPFLFGVPYKSILLEAATITLGRLYRVNPSAGAFTVTIAPWTFSDVGRSLTIANMTSSTNVITVGVPTGYSIIGSATNTMNTAYGMRSFLVVSANLMIIR